MATQVLDLEVGWITVVDQKCVAVFGDTPTLFQMRKQVSTANVFL